MGDERGHATGAASGEGADELEVGLAQRALLLVGALPIPRVFAAHLARKALALRPAVDDELLEGARARLGVKAGGDLLGERGHLCEAAVDLPHHLEGRVAPLEERLLDAAIE